MADWGFLWGQRHLIFDRDSKFCASFRKLIRSAGIKTIRLPPRSPNLHAHAERYVKSVKEESDAIECKQRLGGMLKYYYREAA